uniref:Uncharacterized protein n=1 Tax=Scleropages formosus TaxID=113540 RepID=A0A8C9TB88_SCLFO
MKASDTDWFVLFAVRGTLSNFLQSFMIIQLSLLYVIICSWLTFLY